MLISLNWLRLYLSEITTEEILNLIRENFDFLGLEVESIKKIEKNWKGVIVAKLIALEEVPNTKKLKKCLVFDGKENLQVVCGGDDLQLNCNYAFTPIGSSIGDLNIAKRPMQGLISQGMLCSYKEIGINSMGTMALLDENFIPGTPLEKVYKIDFFTDDYLVDISVTPNRADCLSYFGIARELSACSNGSIKFLEPKMTDVLVSKEENNIEIINELHPNQCFSFYTMVIKNLPNQSPLWLKILLTNIGLKSNYFAVDLTNFLMEETGQPSHVFDYNYLIKKIGEGYKFYLKNQDSQINFKAINENNYSLPHGAMILSAKDKDEKEDALSLLGIIGGETSSYSGSSSVLLEVANFEPEKIRSTNKILNINTSACYKFARKANCYNEILFINRFVSLLKTPNFFENSEIVNKTISFSNVSNKIKFNNSFNREQESIFLSYGDWYKITGFEMSMEKQINILLNLGFEAKLHSLDKGNHNVLGISAKAPFWRKDVMTKGDLIQEIIRLQNLENIQETYLNTETLGSKNKDLEDFLRENTCSIILSNLGYKEIMTDPFLHGAQKNSKDLIKIKTQGNVEMFLNPSLIFKIYESFLVIKSKAISDIKLFTLAKTFFKNSNLKKLEEYSSLCGLLWNNSLSHEKIFSQAKNDIKNLLARFDQDTRQLFFKKAQVDETRANSYLHQNKTASIILNGEEIGVIGVLNTDLEINSKTVLWEIYNIENLSKKSGEYPALVQDFEFTVKKIHISFFVNEANMDIEDIKASIYTQFAFIKYCSIIDSFKVNNKTSYTIELSWHSHFYNEISSKFLNDKVCDYLSSHLHCECR